MYPTSKKHKAIIHIAQHQLKMDDANYRALLHSAAGITSARDLQNTVQFKAIMQAFEKAGYKRHTKKLFAGQPDKEWGCTIKQRRLIEVLWKKYAHNPSTDALYAFIQRTAHVPPQFLTIKTASNVIVGIEQL